MYLLVDISSTQFCISYKLYALLLRKTNKVFLVVLKLFHIILSAPNNSNYWIMDTDYDNYAIIYSCKNLSDNKSAEAAWVLSKQRTLKPEVHSKVDQLVEQYLVRADMRVTEQSQSKCKYDEMPGQN